ncbi:MAG TPA: MATE family efflux transporter, partial [Gammaproteobacteria bacterium]|nr:MATE family efflux transporter [Gammaproteobacteria bacterium]
RTGYRVKPTLTHRLLDAGAIRKLLNANFNLFIRTLCLIFSFAWFTNRSAQLGDLYLAANAVLLHLQTISAYALDGFAHAAETLVGRAVGERKRSALLTTIRVSTLWALIVSSIISLIYLITGSHLLNWMTNHSDVLILARAYLPWVVIGPIISVWSFQLDGIFIGATRTREMRNAMLISLGGYLLAVEASIDLAHNHGLWLSLLLFFVLRALTLSFYLPRIIATTH